MSEKELIEKDLNDLAYKQEEEQIKNLERYHYLKEHGFILFETITGSQSHGTNTDSSDIDKAFVYILPEEDILGIRYKEQLKIHKDFMGYEVRRFLELLRSGNPTILELLNSPEDCILVKHPAFDILLNQKDKFITKACENSFYGYAKQQRSKAEGLEKLQNWEVNRVSKKGPIDFCSVPVGYGFRPMTDWLKEKNLDQMFCGLAAVDHCRDLYAVFYDHEAYKSFSKFVEESEREEYRLKKIDAGDSMGFGYKGIAFEDSNDIRISNIPKEERTSGFICHTSYNKDGYTKHCKDYKRYENWLINRNETRWVEIKGHGQQIDGKNMMHFMRLVLVGREIAQGKGIKIRREDAGELLKIRKGDVPLQELFDNSDIILNEMKSLFQNSNLPNEVSEDFIHKLLVDIRCKFYANVASGYSKDTINIEAENSFMLKRFGIFSELYDFINNKIVEQFTNNQEHNFVEFLESSSSSIIMNGFIYNSNRWPDTRNSIQKRRERVSCENFSVLKMTRDKISVMCGGDWQDPIRFDIVVWQDTLAAINIEYADKWSDGIGSIEFFKQLGHTITNGYSN